MLKKPAPDAPGPPLRHPLPGLWPCRAAGSSPEPPPGDERPGSIAAVTTGRDVVLVAAAEIEAEGGMATPEAVAEALHATPGEVRELFPDHEALLGAVGRFAARRVAAAVEAAGPEGEEPARAVHRLVRQLVPEAVFVLFLLGEGPLPGTEGALWEGAIRRIDELFLRGQRTGVFCGDLPSSWLGENLLEPVVDAGYEVSEGKVSLEEACEQLASSRVAFAAEPFHEPPSVCARRALEPDPPGMCGPHSTCERLRRA